MMSKVTSVKNSSWNHFNLVQKVSSVGQPKLAYANLMMTMHFSKTANIVILVCNKYIIMTSCIRLYEPVEASR